MGKFAVVEYIHSTPHLETSVEAAFHLALEGNSVTYYYLGWSLPFVDFRRNILGLPLDALLRARRLLGRGVLPLAPQDFFGVINHSFPNQASLVEWRMPVGLGTGPAPRLSQSVLRDIDSLGRFEWENLPFGLGLANSITGVTGRIDPPLKHLGRLLSLVFRAQVHAYRWMCLELEREKFSDVLVFNGRFAVPQALGFAAKNAEANLWFHERGGADNSGYSLLPFSPHSPKHMGQEIARRWRVATVKESTSHDETARLFFSDQKRGLDPEGASWVPDPVKFGSGAAIAQPGFRKVVFFASTEGEFEFFGTNGPFSIFASQREALQKVSDLASEGGFTLIVRAHPNVAKQNQSEIDWWRTFKKKNESSCVHVITAEQNIDSFQLLATADCVITWHSTMALHAVFNGIPTVTLMETPGAHVTSDLHLPRTEAQFLSLLKVPPPVRDRNSVLPIGYFLSVSDHKYRFFHANGLRTGTFGAVRLGN